MKDKDVLAILCQAQSRLIEAWKLYLVDGLDEADKELSELRDVLDDIYDRPDEKLIEPDPAAGR